MKLLTATKETQGTRSNDFCFCDEGELLMFGFECDGEAIDGKCGCKRAMAGMDSLKATTTMKVIDVEMTEAELFDKLKAAMNDKGGWNLDDQTINEGVAEIMDIVNHFNLGDVLEKRGGTFNLRARGG